MRVEAPELLESTLRDGLRARMRVTGRSMCPFIENAEVVEFAPSKVILPGDIVLVRHDSGALLLHRVVRIAREGLYLRGDALAAGEGPFQPGRVIAQATGVVRDGRLVSLTGFCRVAGVAWQVSLPLRRRVASLERHRRRWQRRLGQLLTPS